MMCTCKRVSACFLLVFCPARNFEVFEITEMNLNWSGEQSFSTGIGLKNRGGRGGGKGESTACVASVPACGATGGPGGDKGLRRRLP